MRRLLVISLCIMNACIAAGLLWFVFGNKPDRLMMLEQASKERLSDVEYWEQALSAESFREALFQLSQIENLETLKAQATQEIEKLLPADQPPLDRWPFFQAALQKYGNTASNSGQLSLLAQITSNTNQPITLRDTAFKSYVENYYRLRAEAQADTPFVLIDKLFKEKNSLAEIALQAEHFLVKNGVLLPGRELVFKERLRATLQDRQQTESMRITAFNILRETDQLADLPLMQLYPEAGERLQASILQALARSDASEAATHWLETTQPTTPEQEQLRLRILGQ